MKHERLKFEEDFRVVFQCREVQAAEMTLGPGDDEGGPDNYHRGADQWLYVVSGKGLAIVDGVEQGLESGSLLVVEKGEKHEIRNTGSVPLKTLNFYSPPAYDRNEDPLPAGRK
jgi:mannose-6-phosphate isomerase-like protein (cupin superfamily)